MCYICNIIHAKKLHFISRATEMHYCGSPHMHFPAVVNCKFTGQTVESG